MKATVFAGSLLTGLVLTAPARHSRLQPTSSFVAVRSPAMSSSATAIPPIAARWCIGIRHAGSIVVERYAPRVIVVERVRGHRQANYWARHGYRPVTLFYVDGRYYDRRLAGRGARSRGVRARRPLSTTPAITTITRRAR